MDLNKIFKEKNFLNLGDLWMGKEFLHLNPKSTIQKGKVDKLDLIKITTFAPGNTLRMKI